MEDVVDALNAQLQRDFPHASLRHTTFTGNPGSETERIPAHALLGKAVSELLGAVAEIGRAVAVLAGPMPVDEDVEAMTPLEGNEPVFEQIRHQAHLVHGAAALVGQLRAHLGRAM